MADQKKDQAVAGEHSFTCKYEHYYKGDVDRVSTDHESRLRELEKSNNRGEGKESLVTRMITLITLLASIFMMIFAAENSNFCNSPSGGHPHGTATFQQGTRGQSKTTP